MRSDSSNAEALFHRALEFSPKERAAFLADACGGDLPLRKRVEALVIAHEEAKGFLPGDADAGPVATVIAETQPHEQAGLLIGRYKLLERLGEGGFGAVWLAEQREPVRRRLALKVVKLGMDTKQVVARFEAERQALALMDHPNIAKVLDAGTTDAGRPYFVMELVRGIPITRFCDENQMSTKDRLDLFIKVCQAIQHAHQKGIIHRDIKPSNILVTLHDGIPVPKVIDFGIAKATQGELTDKTIHTHFQQFIGTPAYMSPEQAEMSGLDIDTRSDIYSLGVLLYELLTGKTPFDSQELMLSGLDEMRRTIREKEPVRPSTRLDSLRGEERTTAAKRRGIDPGKLAHLLRGDLDWIAMKCLEKDRTRRYETANGLAADLKRHLNHEPVAARPPSAAYRFQKAWRRNKLAFAAAAAVALALTIGAVVSSWQARRATQAKAVAVAAQVRAEKARSEESQQRLRAENESNERSKALAAARRSLYAADMSLAQQALTVGNLGRASELLSKHLPQVGDEDIRGWEWRYLWRRSASDELFTIGHHSNGVTCVEFSPKGNLLASSSRDVTVRLWDLRTRKPTAELIHPNGVQSLAFSRTGNLLATAAFGKNVILWDVTSGEEMWRVPIPGELYASAFTAPIAFSPQADDVLAVGDRDGLVSIWDTTRRTLLASNIVLSGSVHAIAYSGDAQRLAVGSHGGRIQLCDTDSLRPLISLVKHDGWVSSVAFSPDNRMLASSSWDHTIILWDPETGAKIGRLTNHTAWVSGVAFSPDGRRLVSVSADHSIRLWEVATLQEITRLKGHEHEVLKVAMSPNGELLATGGKDHSVKLWNAIPKPTEQTSLTVHTEAKLAVSADQTVFLSSQSDGKMQLWNSKDLSLLRTFDAPINEDSALALSPGGRAIAFGQSDGRLRIWSSINRKFLADFQAHTGRVELCQYSMDGPTLATLGDDQIVRVWDAGPKPKMIHEYAAPHSRPTALVLSTDGNMMALGYRNENDARGFVRLWNLRDQVEVPEFAPHLEAVWAIAFTADGKKLATGSTDGTAKLWDIHDLKQPKHVLRGRLLAVNSLSFSPDDRRLAVSGDSGETKIWDVRSGQEVATLKGGDGFIMDTFFVDQDTFVTHGPKPKERIAEIFLWRAPSLVEIDRAIAHAAASDTAREAP